MYVEMIAHGKDIKIFCGSSNQALALDICKKIGTSLGDHLQTTPNCVLLP